MKKIRKTDVLALVFLIVVAVVYSRYGYKNTVLPEFYVNLENPWSVKTDAEGNTYILDAERSRIVVLDGNQKVKNMIHGNAPQGNTFYYADDFCVGQQGHIYVHDVRWAEAGFHLVGEAIIEYDKAGNFVQTLYEEDYTELYTNKHRIFGLTEENGCVRFVLANDDGCYVKALDRTNGEEVSSVFYQMKDAYTYLQDMVLSPETDVIVAIDKRGKLIELDAEGVKTLYHSLEVDSTERKAVFYRLSIEGDCIYVTDIYLNRLLAFHPEQESIPQTIAEGDNLWDISSCGDTISYVADGQAIVMSVQQEVQFSGDRFEKGMGLKLYAVLYSVFCCLTVPVLGYLFLRIIGVFFSVRFNKTQKMAMIVAGTAAIVTVIVVIELIGQFSDIYREELLSKLNLSAETVCSLVDTDELDHIKEPTDYMDKEFRSVYQLINTVIDKSSEKNEDIYCNILKWDGSEIYTVIYQDNSIGCYYPLTKEEEQNAKKVYESKISAQSDAINETGSYIFVRVPIIGADGEVHGITEVGTLTSVLTSKVNSMVLKILISLVMIILIILFLFNEGFSFIEAFGNYREKKGRGEQGVPLHIVRFLIFITFVAFNMATSFLPVYISMFVSKNLGIPEALAGSLPMTLNLMCIGLTSLSCTKLMKRMGFRRLALMAALVAVSGDVTMAFCKNYLMIVIGLILNGIGVGLITNSIHIFIADSKAEEVEKEGFSIFNAASLSGINCGMMFGASLASAVGKNFVFVISSVMWCMVFICFLIFGSTISISEEEISKGEEDTQEAKLGVVGFLSKPEIFGYMLCVQVPYIVMSSFNYYFVPMFCDENGMGEDVSCLLIMLNSLCSVYLSVGLTNVLQQKIGKNVLYLSSAITLAAMMLFAWKGTLPTLILALIFMGIANSFGTPSRADYFIGMPSSKELGEGTALGIYDFVDNVGESAGPMIFSSIMSVGFLSGAAVLTGITAGLNGIYAFCTRKKGTLKKKTV